MASRKTPSTKAKGSSVRARKEPDAREILNPKDDPTSRISLPRLGYDGAQRLLDDIGTDRIESDMGLNMRLEGGGSGLYRLEERDGVREIVVNKQSEVFRAFRNPLHLLAMIQDEVLAFVAPSLGAPTESNRKRIYKTIKIRNALWEGRISRLTHARAENFRARNIDLLYGDLPNLCKHIMEKFSRQFQFTALSTLAEYLNQVPRIHTFTIYVTKGTGRILLDILRTHGEYVALLEPTSREIGLAYEMSDYKHIIIIREYASVPKSVAASLEKSWVDFFFETTRKGMQYFEGELEMVEALLSLQMVNKDTIMAWAKRRKIETDVREYLAVQHSDS